ncbi:MAG: ComEA family DNA-binding protein [Campylobacterota bacterium]
MLKVFIALFLSASFLFAAIDVNKASKNQLMEIKGIGEKKAELLINYRKNNKIENLDELTTIKGFGPKLVEQIKKASK